MADEEGTRFVPTTDPPIKPQKTAKSVVKQKSLLVGVNRQTDANNITDLERQHIPVIDAPELVRRNEAFDVTVQVGDCAPTPRRADHSIEFIDLYADETYLARVQLTPGHVQPKITFRLVLCFPFKELRALARCGLHGMWLGSRPVRFLA